MKFLISIIMLMIFFSSKHYCFYLSLFLTGFFLSRWYIYSRKLSLTLWVFIDISQVSNVLTKCDQLYIADWIEQMSMRINNFKGNLLYESQKLIFFRKFMIKKVESILDEIPFLLFDFNIFNLHKGKQAQMEKDFLPFWLI